MTSAKTEKSPYTQLIYRPFWITITCLLLILTVALGILMKSSWNALHRVEPLRTQLTLVEQIQRYSAELEELGNQNGPPVTQPRLLQFTETLKNKLLNSPQLTSESRATLLRVHGSIAQLPATTPPETLLTVKKDLRQVLHNETESLNKQLTLLAKDNRIELETGTFIAVTLPILGLLMLFFLRHRILRPLDGLGLLISRLGHQTHLPAIPLERVDPLLRPLFIDFNHMVQRLTDLESAQHRHQQELENRVRLATQSLLEYHHTLAQSERLAAVGELTAGLAHELRNPLAGIQLALANLRNETTDPDHIERLSLIMEALQNITTLLNQVLNQSMHTPEAASRFQLSTTVSSLLQLVRYQISPDIVVEQQIADDIHCHLPQGRLRQALLNLILNAAQSIDKKPGHILLHAWTEQDQLRICISDNGPGFPQKLLANGIQTFVTSRDQGTGLGLAMVRRFCHDQGGSLSLSNREQGGAVVQMNLPWKP